MTVDEKAGDNYRSSLSHGITCYVKLLLLLQVVPSANGQNNNVFSPPKPYSFDPKFSPSTTIILVVLMTIFFFLGFFSVYIRQCLESYVNRGVSSEGLGGGGRRSRRAGRGLDLAVIDTFPTFLYSVVKGLKIGKGALECAVCLNEFEEDDSLRLLPKCSHVFHPGCIDAWLASHVTCPVCRSNLVPDAGEPVPNQVGSAGIEQVDSDHVSVTVNEGDLQSSDASNNPFLPNQNRPSRSRSMKARISGKIPRSHSTGHSLVQLGDNSDRFTLRLPKEVRSELLNSSLNRTKSWAAFEGLMSSRSGYRSGEPYYEPFDRVVTSDRLGSLVAQPVLSRAGSVRSPFKGVDVGTTATQSVLLRPPKAPSDRDGKRVDYAGERATERVRCGAEQV